MIGIIPAAGAGQRIQPLGCSKELLPVGARVIDGVERPKAVMEYLVERMIAAGADQICIVISGEKTDIVRYFAERELRGRDLLRDSESAARTLRRAVSRGTICANARRSADRTAGHNMVSGECLSDQS